MSTEVRSERKRNELWNFFERLNGTYATCNICKLNFSFGSGVSNLKKHLLRKHPNYSLSNDVNVKCHESSFEESSKEESIDYEEEIYICQEPTSPVHPKSSSPQTNSDHRQKRKFEWDRSFQYSTESDDELEAIGTTISCKLRRMEERQRNISEYLINQILFHGLSNRLDEEVKITFPAAMISKTILIHPMSDTEFNQK